jgi:hypothetical protein
MTALRALVALAMSAGPAAAEVCEIRGQDVTLTSLVVRPPGAAAFELDVEGVPAVARLVGTDVQVDIAGAIELTAKARPGIWYTVATDAEDSMVRMLRGAHLVGQRAQNGTLVGRAVLHARDVLPGEHAQPDELVERVSVACSKLSLDWFSADVEPEIGGDDTFWTARGGTLRLFTLPSERANSVTLHAPSCSGKGCIHVETIERKRGWLKVGARNEHTAVVGWVRTSKVVRVPDDTLTGYSYGCYGDHGTTAMHAYVGGAAPKRARIKRGTLLHAEPNIGAWGKVVVEDGYEVRYAPGDAWAMVTRIPGVTLRTGSAYVPVAALLP